MFTDYFKLTPDNPPNDGILFVDHSKNGRSGHLGHALVEYEPGKLLAFYPDCSSIEKVHPGHSGHGWMRYKRSLDGGKSWSEPQDEVYSKRSFDESDGKTTMMIEKIAKTDTGKLVMFYLVCDMTRNGHVWEPFFNPLFSISDDNGESWSEPKELIDLPGRVFDVRCRDGLIYVLFNHDEMPMRGHDAPYYLLVSEDDGESWQVRATPLFEDNLDACYGTMCFMEDGTLIVYTYDLHDEYNLRYVTSRDLGQTWSSPKRAFMAKRMRNPQIARLNGKYLMHGRSGSRGEGNKKGNFVIYISDDGFEWDEGTYLSMKVAAAGAYSNNVIVHDRDGKERLLIQCSRAYDKHKTNVLHFFVDTK